MDKEKILQIIADLYIEGYPIPVIVRKLAERCQDCPKLPSERTIRRWIAKHKDQWDLKRKQKEILQIEQANKERASLQEAIQIEIDKADALDYKDIDDLQKRYKEIAMTSYKPRAVEIVLQCIRLKREIREGLRPEMEQTVKIVFDIPEKGEGWQK